MLRPLYAYQYIITVPDLPVCVDQRGGPQCCSTEYILNQLNITEQLFIDGLRLELQGRFQAFNNIVDRIRACKLQMQTFRPIQLLESVNLKQ